MLLGSWFLTVKVLNFIAAPMFLFLWWLAAKAQGRGMHGVALALRLQVMLLAVAPIAGALTWLYSETGYEYFPMIATLVLLGGVISLPGLAIVWLSRSREAAPSGGWRLWLRYGRPLGPH